MDGNRVPDQKEAIERLEFKIKNLEIEKKEAFSSRDDIKAGKIKAELAELVAELDMLKEAEKK